MHRKGNFANASRKGFKDKKQLKEVPKSAPKFPCSYQGGCEQNVNKDFDLEKLGCFICQTNFDDVSKMRNHKYSHGSESNFKLLSEDDKKMKNIFEINYHRYDKFRFCFTMKTRRKDVVVKETIIVQPRLRWIKLKKKNSVPHNTRTGEEFLYMVSRDLFKWGVEQPIVVVYSYKMNNNVRFIEQHNFLIGVEMGEELKCDNYPENELDDSFIMKLSQESNFSDKFLRDASKGLGAYFDDGNILNYGNMSGALGTMINIEYFEEMQPYKQFDQSDVKVESSDHHQPDFKVKNFDPLIDCETFYMVELQVPKNVCLENIVTPLDEIVLIENQTKEKFVGTIEEISDNKVYFSYEGWLDIFNDKTYEVNLRPSQLTFKYQLRALALLYDNDDNSRNFLFPRSDHILPVCLSTEKLELFNNSIESNFEQLQAVRNIAVGPDVSVPYVLFGPPGTGKTSTIVETVLQLWKRRPETRILILSGSNGACDEVALRLCREFVKLRLTKPIILRLFAKSNKKRLQSIDDVLIQYSNFCNTTHFYPSLEVIYEFRIIVCTLSVAGRLVSVPISEKFFSHIFIDECGASTEPETLVGWLGISSSTTRLIVSGDPKQLGPVLKSKRAANLGLKVSFMERLMKRDCYAVDRGQYNRSIQTRLIRNYRSHPEIVQLYNQLYYNNELKPLAPKDETDWAMKWNRLPAQNYPIVFHSVYGRSKQNGSGSFYNELENRTVIQYVKDLMHYGINGRKITEADIGIISPYKMQYTMIKKELNLRRWNKIEVGAVETFQGREKSIIIVSTVRSFTKSLGFLDCPRRLNVILSRAKALLIIIGNPITLSKYKDFKFIIDKCLRKKSTIGSFHGYTEDNIDKLNDSMERLKFEEKDNIMQNQKCDKVEEKVVLSLFKGRRRSL